MFGHVDTFAARANAVFRALGEPTGLAGWRLDPAQGFEPGAEDALEQDSSEDGEEVQEPESLPGADDSEEEQSYKQKASKCYRRAFEREEEEDEFDRVAAGASAQEQRPARSMEVLEDNVFDRMHSQSYRAAPAGPSTVPVTTAAALEQQQQPMDLDVGPPPVEPAAAQHVCEEEQQQQQVHEQQQEDVQDQLPQPQEPSGQAGMPAQRQSDNRPRESAVNGGQQQHHSQHLHQQERRVRFVDGKSHAEDSRRQQQVQQQQGRARGSRVTGRGGGGRRGQSFVPDHVRSPQKYTVYTLDEPIYVGQGDRDMQEMQALSHGLRADYTGRRSSRAGRGAADRGKTAAVDAGVDHGRWQDGDDETPMLLDASAAASGADADMDCIAAAAEPVTQLPPMGSIKFQPSSKRAKMQNAAGTACESHVAHQGHGSRAQDNGPPESAPRQLGSTVFAAFIDQQTQDDEPADGASIAARPAAAAHGKSSRQRHYRRKAATDEG